MTVAKSRDNESFEQLLRRFKKQCEKAAVLTEVRKRENFEKPSIRKKRKDAAARKRAAKKTVGGPPSQTQNKVRMKDFAINF